MNYARLFLILLTFGVTATVGFSQDTPPAQGAADNEERRQMRRPDLLAELGLSPEQVQKIRRMNQERRPTMMEARRRMGEAAQNLDLAIYGESVNDSEIQTRLKEFQAAEAELSRLRFENELAVRKVLTPEQLVRFRELRRQFAEQRRNGDRRMRRRGQRNEPMKEGPFRRPVH